MLNEQMSSLNELSPDLITSKKEEFENCIEKILAAMGFTAFMNISEKDVLIQKFHPTIFDSIAVATNIAIKTGIDPAGIPDIKNRRTNLLKDPEYKEFIRIETMNIPHIQGRISKAAKHLYNINI